MGDLTERRLFWYSSLDSDQAKARALPVFNMWQQMGHDVQTGTVLDIEVARTHMLVTVPSYRGVADVVRRLSREPTSAVIVDVPQNVFTPHTLPDTRAQAFWADGRHTEAARDAIRTADAVAVSDDSVWAICTLLNPNCFVMPDPVDETTTHRNSSLLLRHWAAATHRKRTR